MPVTCPACDRELTHLDVYVVRVGVDKEIECSCGEVLMLSILPWGEYRVRPQVPKGALERGDPR